MLCVTLIVQRPGDGVIGRTVGSRCLGTDHALVSARGDVRYVAVPSVQFEGVASGLQYAAPRRPAADHYDLPQLIVGCQAQIVAERVSRCSSQGPPLVAVNVHELDLAAVGAQNVQRVGDGHVVSLSTIDLERVDAARGNRRGDLEVAEVCLKTVLSDVTARIELAVRACRRVRGV